MHGTAQSTGEAVENGVIFLRQELLRIGNDTVLFPHLNTILRPSWFEIEELLLTLIKEMNATKGPQ